MPPTDAPNCRLELDDTSIAWLYLDSQDSDNNVLSVPEDYEYFNALRAYATRTQLKAHWPVYAAIVVVTIGLIGFLVTRRFLYPPRLNQ